MPEDISKQNIVAKLSNRGFKTNPAATIIIATFSGMTLMFLGIMLGTPILISMILLFGGIYLVYGLMAGYTHYELTNEGLTKSFESFLSKYTKSKRSRSFYPFTSIKSFSITKDLSRSLKEVETLKISLDKAPHSLWITNQINPNQFEIFSQAFVTAVNQYNQGGKVKSDQSTESQEVVENVALPKEIASRQQLAKPAKQTTTKVSKPKRKIKQKGGFYKTFWAKLLTVIFVAMSIVFLIFWANGYLRPTHVFRLLIIILPGMMYMVYRVFGKGGK